MAYETNRFCWHGLISTDTERAAAFYQEAVGWSVLKQPMGDSEATMFVANDVPMAHYMAPPMEGVPSHWNNYLRVTDLDASLEAAVANGGEELVPATVIPPGRFAVVKSPSGATISLFHEADEETATHHPGGTGSVHWVELHSTDIDADIAWLKSTFNYTTDEMPLPHGGTYYILKSDDQPRGGANKAFFEGAPSMWLTWFSVDDIDSALNRVTTHGGEALGEIMDMENVGKMFVAKDPTGAVFGLIQPSDASN